jgi:hypothetical protein
VCKHSVIEQRARLCGSDSHASVSSRTQCGPTVPSAAYNTNAGSRGIFDRCFSTSPLSPSPHANGFEKGKFTAVINTHTKALPRINKQLWTETRIGSVLPWDDNEDEADRLLESDGVTRQASNDNHVNQDLWEMTNK